MPMDLLEAIGKLSANDADLSSIYNKGNKIVKMLRVIGFLPSGYLKLYLGPSSEHYGPMIKKIVIAIGGRWI